MGRIVWTHQYECTYTTARAYATGSRCTPYVHEGRGYHLGAETAVMAFANRCIYARNDKEIICASLGED